MNVKSATITALLGEAGFDDAWIRERIRRHSFAPMTSTASAKRLRWSFGDAVRLEIYKRLVSAGISSRVGGVISTLPLGAGKLFVAVVNDDGSFKGRPADPDEIPEIIEDHPSARSVIAVSIDDCAAVVSIIDRAAKPDREGDR